MPTRHYNDVYANKFVVNTGQTGATVVDDLTVAGAATVAETLNVTGLITATAGVAGNLIGNLTPATVAAEHGAGAIGTGVAPVTYRWTENGVIITQIKVDLQGLASVATDNDVIGLSTGGHAYIGRAVTSTCGIIYRVSMSCVEVPVTGNLDVNLAKSATGTIAYDGAGGGTDIITGGGNWAAGKTIETLTAGPAANDYYYLTAGSAGAAAAYGSGQFIITTYGHPVLT
jgi:hypothetical protein